MVVVHCQIEPKIEYATVTVIVTGQVIYKNYLIVSDCVESHSEAATEQR